MIDLSVEQPIPLAKACQFVPPARQGRRTHLSTLLRWIQKGAKAPDGTTLRLEAVRIGGRWMTSRAALQRFAEALTPNLGAVDSAPVLVRTEAKRRKASEKAAVELAKVGI